MQSNITLTGINRFFCKISMVLAVLFLISGTMQAQTYVNGNLGTGATSNNGTAAPAGTTWHELQNNTGNTTESNSTLGVSHVSFGATNNTLADDFTVPAGQTWNISTLRIYSLDQVTTTTTSPYSNIRVRIHNGVPGAAGTTVVYGDLTTNRFAATAYTAKRAIFNSQVPTPGAPAPNLPIFSIDATINTTLTAGTYWIEWQVVNTANCFSLTSQTPGVRALPGANAMQFTGAWATLVDGGSPAAAPDVNVELPFSLSYTATGASCTAVSPGNTISSVTAACAAVPFNLSVQTPGSGIGLSYQWQRSTDNVTYTDILGATNPTYSATQAAATWYRLKVTCGANTPLLSTAVNVTMSTTCYCIPATADCTDGDLITNVTIGTLNNNSTCGPSGYTNYTTNPAITVPDLIQGAATSMKVTVGDGGTEFVGVWIDYDHSGSFEASEFTLLGSGNNVTVTGNITIPSTALLGVTRMRVRDRYLTAITGTQACTTGGVYGEVEDYNVNIVPCVPTIITTNPVAATVACGGSTTFIAAASGTVPVYQWQYRTSATGVWLVVPNAAPYSGVSTGTLTIAPASTTLNGYQYRALISGACAAATPTTGAILTVSPLVGVVTPASATICSNSTGTTALTIGNTGAPATSTFSSAANLNITIPDNGTTTGINNTIAVSTLPAGALITGLKVKMNIVHSWVGDLVVVLKAPNGKVYNLAYALTATGGVDPSTGFTNTVISSTPPPTGGSYPTLDSGTDPYTATFQADGFTPATGDPSVPTGPNTFIPLNATVFSDLYGTAGTGNGNWTIALYDYFEDDLTTNKFVNWSLDITYGALATGVFTSAPATPNSMFTDAAGTVPYTGTAVNTVYVHPAATTSYSVAINTGTCTATVTVPVTVNTPATGTPTVANQSTCAGTNATFSVAGITGGTGATYQWQLSTAGGAFANITGATSATYTVTAPTVAQNGNQYLVKITSAGCAAATTLTSTAGTLTVNATPVVVISAAPSTSIAPGSTVTLTAATSPNAAASYQWYNNGVPVTGATSNTLVVSIDGAGSYTVKVTDVNGCSNTAFASTPASIEVTAAQTTQLFVYPSPNTGKFQVRYFNDLNDGTNSPAILNVYDSKGARVFTKRYVLGAGYQAMQVDLASHGKGVYRIDLLNTNGERLKTGNVLVY